MTSEQLASVLSSRRMVSAWEACRQLDAWTNKREDVLNDLTLRGVVIHNARRAG